MQAMVQVGGAGQLGSGLPVGVNEETQRLIDQEIPQKCEELRNSYQSLQNVAMFCETNYLRAPQKQQALDLTMNYTVQSLASVAYQIHQLANDFVQLLRVQDSEMQALQSSVQQLALSVSIHKEKVARCEIGSLTVSKATMPYDDPPAGGVRIPAQTEPKLPYERKAIDYSALDHIGHSVKVENTQNMGPFMGPSNVPSAQVPPSFGTLSRAARVTQMDTQSDAARISANAMTLAGQNRVSTASAVSQPQNFYSGVAAHPQSYMESTLPGHATIRRGSAQQGRPSLPHAMLGEPGASQAMRGTHPSIPDWPSARGFPNPPSAFDFGEAAGAPMPLAAHLSTASYADAYPPAPYGGVVASEAFPPPPDMMIEPDAGAAFDARSTGMFMGAAQHMSMGSVAMDGAYGLQGGGEQLEGAEQRGEGSMPQEYLYRAVVMYDYEPANSDELALAENELIYVLRENSDGWNEGFSIRNGVMLRGLFPTNYVERA